MSSPVTDSERAEKIWSTCQGANDDHSLTLRLESASRNWRKEHEPHIETLPLVSVGVFHSLDRASSGKGITCLDTT